MIQQLACMPGLGIGADVTWPCHWAPSVPKTRRSESREAPRQSWPTGKLSSSVVETRSAVADTPGSPAENGAKLLDPP